MVLPARHHFLTHRVEQPTPDGRVRARVDSRGWANLHRQQGGYDLVCYLGNLRRRYVTEPVPALAEDVLDGGLRNLMRKWRMLVAGLLRRAFDRHGGQLIGQL